MKRSSAMSPKTSKKRPEVLRYAVVGLGHIAQVAVLPAFRHARENSRLCALVSGSPGKARQLAKKYKVAHVFSYDDYDALLESGLIDAVYICLPNTLHREYATRALRKGIHVLCEKPLAPTAEDCRAIIAAARVGNAKLMTAYRLHFEPANLEAIRVAHSGRIGELRYFNSVFSFQIKDPSNIRLRAEMGGGPLYDIGLYCINAARSIFRDEPLEVTAIKASCAQSRFSSVEEMDSVVMKFPGDRLAAFTCSFGAHAAADYTVFGAKGCITVESAFEYSTARTVKVSGEALSSKKIYKKCDQFAPELLHFSSRVLSGRKPEPCGHEGMADVLVVEALLESARTGRTVHLRQQPSLRNKVHPTAQLAMHRAPVKKPKTIGARSPSAN